MDDSEILYTLLVKNVSTSWPGSNIIEKNDNAKNGRRCYFELKVHLMTDSPDQKKI